MKMISKYVVAAALVAGSLTSQYAMAAVHASTGSLAPTTQTLVVKPDTSGGFVGTFDGLYTSGQYKLFSDSFSFTVGGASEAAGTVSAGWTSTQDVYITSFNVYTSTGTLVIEGASELTTSNNASKNDFWSLPDGSTLAAGSYYLKVTGEILGASGGSYSGTLNVTSAVPEPETYGMLLGGLALVGAVARRRAKKVA